MYYEMTIAGCKRQLQLFPVSDDTSIAAFIIFGDVEVTEASAKELLAMAPEFDVIVTPEAKSIPLAYEMSKQCGKPYVVARKAAKVYMENLIETTVDSITTATLQHLCIGQREVDQMKGKRCLLLDDVVSTGSSIDSLAHLVRKAGGEIVVQQCVLAEGAAIDRGDIQYLGELPLFNADGTIKED